ncbi:GNAT family N-acetyltransferase [Tabrizicola sp.]|uniref:GNAT family N-acetyltransferase n=1 Tax=Tabrizicola sp. TaxID=2005166 RepID=UPI00286D20E3|nr:GNAT family N-acetyltransferase [Tabrizicola sp.]
MATEQDSLVRLRPVHPDDKEFIYSVYASARAEEMAIVPWNDEQREMFLRSQFAAQQKHYQGYYPEATHQIILLSEQPVGRLYVDRQEQEIRILDITILPGDRGRGIGGPLVRQLMNEAATTNRRLTIYIESFNRSRSLFERLGFVPVEETGVHLLFEWHADNHKT